MRRFIAASLVLSLALVAAVLFSVPAHADIVVLTNGGKVEGTVVDKGDHYEVTRRGIKTVIPKDRVQKIIKQKLPEELYPDMAAKLADTDAEGHFKLALWCKERGLRAEMIKELEKTLAADPNHVKAHEELGHVQYEGKWVTLAEKKRLEDEKLAAEMAAKGLVKHKDRWVTPEERDALEKGLVKYDGKWMTEDEMMAAKGLAKHEGKWIPKDEKRRLDLARYRKEQWAECEKFNAEDRKKDSAIDRTIWDNAFEFHTPRYYLKSDISREIIEFVGKHMQETYETYVEQIPVPPPDEEKLASLPVLVFRSEETFRKVTGQPNATGVYTSKDIEIFHKKPEDPWSKDLLLLTLDHEACHYYLDMAIPGEMPRWVDEGLSTYFAILRMTNKVYQKEYIGEQLTPVQEGLAGKGRVYGLQEVFELTQDGYALGSGETDDERRRDRRLHYGESMTLCGFLLREAVNEKSAYSQVLKRVMTALADGKTSATAQAAGFEGIPLDRFEADWKEYMQKLTPETLFPAPARSKRK